MISSISNYINKKKIDRRMSEMVIHLIIVDLVEHSIKELTEIHGVDMKHVLGDTFMSELRKRKIKTTKLLQIYMTVIQPLLNLKRKENLICSNH